MEYYGALKLAGIKKRLEEHERDIRLELRQNRQIEDYYAIQHHFPQTYGIGEVGLPPSSSPARKGKAKQLKAYLLFFEQILANYFSQLAHVRELLSVQKGTLQTYFSQPLLDVPGIESIIKGYPTDNGKVHREVLENINEDKDTAFDRKNRFTNHLMARFSEQLVDYSLFMVGVKPEVSGSTTTPLKTEGEKQDKQQVEKQREQLIDDKLAFLREYPQHSAKKAVAFNYRDYTPVHAFGPSKTPGRTTCEAQGIH